MTLQAPSYPPPPTPRTEDEALKWSAEIPEYLEVIGKFYEGLKNLDDPKYNILPGVFTDSFIMARKYMENEYAEWTACQVVEAYVKCLDRQEGR